MLRQRHVPQQKARSRGQRRAKTKAVNLAEYFSTKYMEERTDADGANTTAFAKDPIGGRQGTREDGSCSATTSFRTGSRPTSRAGLGSEDPLVSGNSFRAQIPS